MKKTIIIPLLFLIVIPLVLTGCFNKTTQNNDKKTTPAGVAANFGDIDTKTNIETPQQMKDMVNLGIVEGAIIRTNQGDIKLEFYKDESPNTVANFVALAANGFYNGTKFHRVIKDFMIQGGDPNSRDDDWSDDGTGGPGYTFADEFNDYSIVKGSLAMANSGPNTNGSQFFIVTAEATPHLDGVHTNFGYVTEGMDIVAKIEDTATNENDHPLEDIVVESIEILTTTTDEASPEETGETEQESTPEEGIEEGNEENPAPEESLEEETPEDPVEPME